MARASSSSPASPKRRSGLALTAVSALVFLVALPAAHAARPWAAPPPPAAQTKTHHRQNNNWPAKPHERKSGGNNSSGGRFGATQAAGCTTTNPQIPRSTDMVNVWEDTCAVPANNGCGSCDLYNMVVSRAQGAKYVYSRDEDSSGKKIARSKIVPVKPMAGLESIVTKGAGTSEFWVQALGDAKTGGIIEGVPQTNHSIAYANSLDAREQHQLHIHIGAAINDNFYDCARLIIDNPPSYPTYKTHSSNPTSTTGGCYNLAITKKYGVAMAGTVVPANGIDAAIRDGFTKMKVPGANSGDINSDRVLLRTGVLVEQTPKGDYLVVLVYNTDDHLIFGN